MKKFKLFNVCVLFVFSLIIFSTFGATSALAKRVDYAFFNYSGRTIKHLYITGSGYNKWGSDLLGSSVLSTGEGVNLTYDNKVRYFDVKVVWMDDTSSTWQSYDYKSVWRISLYREGSTYYIRGN